MHIGLMNLIETDRFKAEVAGTSNRIDGLELVINYYPAWSVDDCVSMHPHN
jgi:hypothetical protein